jgi:hypothetical protein
MDSESIKESLTSSQTILMKFLPHEQCWLRSGVSSCGPDHVTATVLVQGSCCSVVLWVHAMLLQLPMCATVLTPTSVLHGLTGCCNLHVSMQQGRAGGAHSLQSICSGV